MFAQWWDIGIIGPLDVRAMVEQWDIGALSILAQLGTMALGHRHHMGDELRCACEPQPDV